MTTLKTVLFPERAKELALLLEIGSGSVGGALVLFQEREKPFVLYVAREPITIATKVNLDRLINNKKNALASVLQKIIKNGLPEVHRSISRRINVKNVFAVFSAPWQASESLVVNIKGGNPTVVTLDLLEKVIKEQAVRFEKDPSFEHEPVEVVEKRIIDVSLNGYHVNYMYQKAATELSFTIFLSSVPKRILRELRSALGKSFHLKNIFAHSFTLTNFAVIRDMFGSTSNFLFIDVTGEATEVSLVKKGVLLKTASFPLGRNFIIRKIAEAFSVTPNIARSLISLYSKEAIHEDFKSKFKKALEEARRDWVEVWRNTTVGISDGLILPETVFLTIDKDVEKIFSDWLSNEHFEQFGATKSSFKVLQLDDANLRHFCGWGKNTVYDPFLIIESIFLNKVSNQK